MYMGGEQIAFSILLVYMAVIGVILLFSLVSYIFQGIGMYTLGKRRGMDNAWLAFVPYARTYYQGELCGTLTFKERQVKSPGIWMLLIPIVSNVIVGAAFAMFWVTFAVKMAQFAQYAYSYNSFDYTFSGWGSGLLIFGFIMVLLLSIFASALQSTLMVLVNNQIFARYTDKNYALLHALMGIFIPLYTAIYFFIIRNRE